MSLSGTFMLYTTRRPADPAEAIGRIIAVAQPVERLPFTARWLDEDRTYEATVAAVECNDELERTLESQGEEFTHVVTASQAHKLWIDDCKVMIEPGEDRYSRLIWDGVRERVPESVRGDFTPGSMSITMGWHDIVHVDERSHPAVVHRVARAFASISFFGYGLAKDFDECRRQMSALPEVQQVKAELESILGPLEIWLDWSW